MSTVMDEDVIAATRDIGPTLGDNAERSDRECRLPSESLEAMRRAGLLRMYEPRSLGGLEVDPITYTHVQEELARYDSAAAWILQAVGASAWWVSRLPAETVDEIYAGGPDQVMASAFGFPAEAVPVEGGYLVSGQRPFASNVSDASWVWLTMVTMVDGQPEAIDGAPIVRTAWFPAADATIVPTWDTLGMRGTDSNDVAVEKLFVPERRTFRIGLDHTPGPRYDSPLYRIPAMVLVASIAPAVALGIARGAIDELRAIAEGKTPFSSATTLRERATAQGKLGRAEGALRAARAYLYDRIAWGWERTLAGDELTLEERTEVLLACVQAVDAGAHAVELAYSAAGTTAIYRRSRLEQHFRDMQVLKQHGFVSESRFETVGQVYLGLSPDLGFVAL